MKFLIFIILSLLGHLSFARDGVKCTSLFISEAKPHSEPKFENGHNVPLRNVMLKMREYEGTIQEFVEALSFRIQSEFLKDDSQKFRNVKTLDSIIAIAEKYEKILTHLVEHSDHMMMSPRIQMIPAEKRAEFMAKYKQAYIDYLNTYQKLVLELESFKTQDPKDWDGRRAKHIFMELHAQMGAAHNKF